MGKPKIIIEHMEYGVSRWLLIEYKEVIKAVKNANVEVVFTNVKNFSLFAILGKMGATAISEEGWKVFNRSNAIVLDPEAEKALEPWEIEGSCCIVVGGIMGDHPPRGRTRIISTYYTNSAKRNLGPYQFSIDGAVKVVLDMLLHNKRLNEVKIVKPPMLLHIKGPYMEDIEVELPYAYPVTSDGKPDISSDLISLLTRGIVWDEISLLEEGF